MKRKAVILFFSVLMAYNYAFSKNGKSSNEYVQSTKIYGDEVMENAKQSGNAAKMPYNLIAKNNPQLAITESDRPVVSSLNTDVTWYGQTITITGWNFNRINYDYCII